MTSERTARRFFAPEVIQTSAMDCGPAALKCLLEGFFITVGYGALRDACQTHVDGTSIDAIEEVAKSLGLDAEQTVLPADVFLLDADHVLPALVVTRAPGGATHFVVVWRRHGRLLQVMDPSVGRRWVGAATFAQTLYRHEQPVPADDWREWATTEEFLRPLRARLASLGAGRRPAVLGCALADPSWRSLADLDAAARMVATLTREGALRAGAAATDVLTALVTKAREARDAGRLPPTPDAYYAVVAGDDGEEGRPHVVLRGAVLVGVRGRRTGADRRNEPELAPELRSALNEPPARPERELIALLGPDTRLATLIVGALALGAVGAFVEVVMLRGFADVAADLGLLQQRLGAAMLLVLCSATLLLADVPVAALSLRVGRAVEMRLRLELLRKLPRVGDRYFQSRPVSDMAERCHSVYRIRGVATIAQQFVRATFELTVTAAAIAWFDRHSAPLAVANALFVVAVPALMQVTLRERDLKFRSQAGALSRFYLDALVGLVAARTHGGEAALRREHEAILREWLHTGRSALHGTSVLSALQSIGSLALSAWLVLSYAARAGEPTGMLLLVYWSLRLPALGQTVVACARQYPGQRNALLRLLDLLRAREENAEQYAVTGPSGLADAATGHPSPDLRAAALDLAASPPHAPSVRRRPGLAPAPTPSGGAPGALPSTRVAASPVGVAIEVSDLDVVAMGQTILRGVSLSLAPGTHVAVVGRSGAGKSSLAGVLLGWHAPARGRVLVDGCQLRGEVLERLRRETAWVDPGVQLWNTSLFENLHYGVEGARPLAPVLHQAELRGLLERLPEGLQTKLGESGTLVSGGEGQRVRLGRALLKSDTRFVVLDEPFRGVDRGRRHQLLRRARAHWRGATLMCITHDISEAASFERVLVVDDGRLVEDGSPQDLLRQKSVFRAMIKAEQAVRMGVWSAPHWTRVHIGRGRVIDDGDDDDLETEVLEVEVSA